MYLEISPRRVGKTTRLLENVFKNVLNGYSCCVICPNYTIMNFLQKRYNEKYHKMMYMRNTKMPEFFTRSIPVDKKFDRIYYDEFDFLDRGVLIHNNGYYVTTPRFLRSTTHIEKWYDGEVKDNLLDLLKFNNYEYIVKTNFSKEYLEWYNIALYEFSKKSC